MTTPNKSCSSQVGNSTRRSVATSFISLIQLHRIRFVIQRHMIVSLIQLHRIRFVIQRPRIVSFIKLHRIRFFIQRESLPLSECDIAKVTSGSVAEVTHRSAEEVAHFFPTGVTSAIRMRYCQSNF